MEEEGNKTGLIKLTLGALGLSPLAAYFGFGVRLWIVILILLIFLIVFGGYLLWRKLRQGQLSSTFLGRLTGGGSAGGGPTSPEAKRLLDDVRRKFQEGLDEFKRGKKDVYLLPWYIIMGESGAGKTEAIRSALLDDMPPSLQHYVPGSGGTVNMNWWFTNRAVILDTAGKMVVPDKGQSGDSPEWNEFLKLLAKSRPHCPINGLLLVLSVESLIKDSAERISEKAGHLARQLNLIQRTLDVRFPVYLIIAKCDLLTGFREFCNSITDPIAQHQILGWSNPAPLDDPFRPELVEDHLESVIARINRRRLDLLREGVASSPGLSGTTFFTSGKGFSPAQARDATDALFALPDSLKRLAPRLRRYLETIFVADVWSAKPVFLRGIYFTSSMREGGALDEALALAMGLPVEQVAEQHAATEKRAFFLKDMFKEKVFSERGLVTKATNTTQYLRQRKIMLYGAVSVAVLGFLGFAYLGGRQLEGSIGKEVHLWKYASQGWVGQGNLREWRPEGLATNNHYTGTQVLPGLGKDLGWEDYQLELAQMARTDSSPGWMFKPIQAFAKRGLDEAQRAEAQRTAFEGGVVRPLVRMAREQLGRTDRTLEAQELTDHLGVLQQLVVMEEEIQLNRRRGLDTNTARQLIDPMFRYLFRIQAPASLVQAFTLVYPTDAKDKTWPPEWLKGGTNLNENLAIAGGLKAWQQFALTTQTNVESELSWTTNLIGRLASYRAAETNWLTTAVARPAEAISDFSALTNSWAAVTALEQGSAATITNLQEQLKKLAERAGQVSSGPVSELVADTGMSSSSLRREIKGKLDQFSSEQSRKVESVWGSQSNLISLLDREMISPVGVGKSAAAIRFDHYHLAMDVATNSSVVSAISVGGQWQFLAGVQKEADSLGTKTNLAGIPLGPAAERAMTNVAMEATGLVARHYAAEYQAYVEKQLRELSSPSRLDEAIDFFTRLSTDLADANCPANLKVDLQGPFARARKVSITGFLEDKRKGLSDVEKFPVDSRGDPRAGLAVAALVELRKQLGALAAQGDKFAQPPFNKEDREQLDAGMASLLGRTNVIDALVLGNRARTFSMQFADRDKQKDPDLVKATLRYALFLEKDASNSWDVSRSGEPTTNVPLDRDGPILLAGARQEFAAMHDPDSGVPWRALMLLKRASTQDQRTWVVTATGIKGSDDKEHELVLTITLDQPLPKNW